MNHQDAVDSLDEPTPHILVIKTSSGKVVGSRLRILPLTLIIDRRLLLSHAREGLLLRRILGISLLRRRSISLLRVSSLVVVRILGIWRRLDKTCNKDMLSTFVCNYNNEETLPCCLLSPILTRNLN